jgi:hypothetical protein
VCECEVIKINQVVRLVANPPSPCYGWVGVNITIPVFIGFPVNNYFLARVISRSGAHLLPMLKKIAEALDTNVDFLINSNTEDKAKASLNDAEVIRYSKKVDNLPTEDKFAQLRVNGGFLRDVKTKQAYAS